MATIHSIIPNTPSHTLSIPTRASPHMSFPRALPLTRRRTAVITRAGSNSSKYLFAFLLPVSLIGITVFTSLRLSDKMDRNFLEEQARNQAIKEAEDAEDYAWVEFGDENEDNDEDEVEDENEAEEIFVKEVPQPVLSRSRIRPKKEV